MGDTVAAMGFMSTHSWRRGGLFTTITVLLLAYTSALDPKRVHLVDMYPRTCPDGGNDCPRNYLFRGNNPVSNGVFNFTALTDALRTAASGECGVKLPETFQFVDVDLENPTDKGYSVELKFWKQNPTLGHAVTWPLLGSALEPKHTPGRDGLVKSGKWAVAGNADGLVKRLNETRTMLLNTTAAPTVMFAHCNAGCDRTGEFIGAYAMTYMGYNVTTAMGEGCRQCGRCPNYFASSAIGWWCLTLKAQGRTDIGNCLDFCGCKLFKSCDAHNATHPAHPCP